MYSHINIPRDIFYKKDRLLNVEELYLYFYLLLQMDYVKNRITRKLWMLAQDIVFVKNVAVNRDRIIKSLVSLCEKDYIMLIANDMDDVRRNYFDISLPMNRNKELITGPSSLFSVAESPLELGVLLFLCASHTTEISFDELTRKMINTKGKSFAQKTVVTTIKKLEECGVISIEHGRFFQQKRKNQYNLNLEMISNSQ